MKRGLPLASTSLACSSASAASSSTRIAAAEADLRQPRAFPDQDREGARAHFEIERAAIAFRHLVEGARLVGDDAGEDVEPPGRAFRIGACRDVGGKVEAFQERHDIDAAGLQDGAAGDVELVQRQLAELLRHREFRTRQEAGAHPRRLRPEAKVEARRLQLARRRRLGEIDMSGRDQAADRAVRQDAFAVRCRRCRHRRSDSRAGH